MKYDLTYMDFFAYLVFTSNDAAFKNCKLGTKLV